MQHALLKMERNDRVRGMKIGVLFAKHGQQDENDMFGNGACACMLDACLLLMPIYAEHGSAAFNEFLELLGSKVRLKHYPGYSAQLDVESKFRTHGLQPLGAEALGLDDGSGLWSVSRHFQGYKVMFHVSTLMQYDVTDEQHVSCAPSLPPHPVSAVR